jgi:chemotaxis protein methyltransferase CheR
MFAGTGTPNNRLSREDKVIVLDQDEVVWRPFQRTFLKATGLDLSAYRSAQIRRRVESVAAAANESMDSLEERLESGPVLASVALHQIAIHTTQLFRDPDCWIDLRDNIVPEMIADGNELNIWCGACANGAEAYSLASLLVQQKVSGTILATDIDSIILENAVRGRFTHAQARNAQALLAAQHFEPRGDGYLASPKLGRRIAFHRQDLLGEPPAFDFDLICCRNIAIYLRESACDKLYENLWRALRPGGYLFVGATERLFTPSDYGFQSISPCFYRKLGS